MPSNILLGGIGKVNNSDTSVSITLLTYSPSYKVNSSIISLILSDVPLFTLAVLVIRIYIALNASYLIT